MGFKNRKTWSRHHRVPRSRRISDCDFKGSPFPSRLWQEVPRKPVVRPTGDEELYAKLGIYHQWAADIMHYAKWYAANIGSQRRAKIRAFADKCRAQMRFQASEDGGIPSEGSLYWHMEWIKRRQLQIIAQYRGISSSPAADEEEEW